MLKISQQKRRFLRYFTQSSRKRNYSYKDPSMVLKLLPGHSSRGGGVIDNKGEEEKGEEKKMAQEKGNEEGGDPIIDSLGEIGKYQLLVGLLFAVMEIPHGWCMLMHKFIAPKVDFTCVGQPNITALPYANITESEIDQCYLYSEYGNNRTKCTEFEFDETNFQNTIAQQWDLVCDNKFLTNIASFLFFSGTGVGVFIAGLLADKFGRRRIILLFIVLFCVSGIICTASPYFELWVAFRFLWGAATLGLRSIKIVMALEMIGSSWRAIICVAFIEGGWTLGYLTLPLISWLIPNATYLQLLVSISILPSFIIVYFLNESPRWLLATGKYEECTKTLANIIAFNKKDTPVADMSKQRLEGKSDASFWDLFKKPMIRRNTIVVSLAWFALGMLYFGLSLHMPEFDANIYIIFFLSGLVEVPADIIPFLLLNRFGRRLNLCLHYIIGGLLCMATAAVPLGVYAYEWPIVVLAMCGKYISQVCWGIVYLYTTELFPTVVRSVALSFACSMARLGSMLAPFIASLAYIDPILPIFVFGIITFLVGLQALLLPETNKKKLPETIEEGEAFYKANNPFKF